jgi:methyltransferase (TIGR00027 family)
MPGDDRGRAASKTAAGSAVWRAVGALEPDPRLRNPDILARLFLPPAYALLPQLPWLSRLGNRIYGLLLPGGYQFETARTMHMDRVVLEQLEAGAEQLVILGAGYDTRAHRFESLLAGRRVFEVDMPAIQARKRERLAANGVATPSQLHYVAVERNHRDLFRDLHSAGYDPRARSFFVWSGVTMYLPENAFDATLAEIHRQTGAGSGIVFDYFSSAVVSGTGRGPGATRVARRVEKLGEPFTLGLNRAELGGLLDRHGFELLSNLGPDDLERRYLTASGRSLGRPFEFASIAEVEKRSDP